MDIEEIVLGTALGDPSTIEEISKLRSTDFSGMNSDLFAVIMALFNEDALSYRSVVETLRNESLLDIIGDGSRTGEMYLRQLVEMADSRGIKSHVRRIEDKSARSNLREVAALLAAEAANENKHIQEVMDEAERRIFNLRRRTKADEGVEFGDLLRAYLPFVDGLRDGSIKPAWIPPLEAVRDLVQYVGRTDFVVLAGRPGEGKSSLLRYDALRTVMGTPEEDIPGQRVVTFNLENDDFEYAKFACATIAGLNSAKLKDPANLTMEEYERFKAAAEELFRIPWNIVTLSRPTALEVDRIARKKVAEGAKLIQIDYLQLMSNGKRSRVEDLAETTGMVRGIALKTNIPVVAASQLNRSIELRGEGAEPRLSDLRESGSIEQDATQVWFIRSLWHDPPTAEEVTDSEYRFEENFYGQGMGMVKDVIPCIPTKIWVKKNRNGPVGKTRPLKWNRSTGRWYSINNR